MSKANAPEGRTELKRGESNPVAPTMFQRIEHPHRYDIGTKRMKAELVLFKPGKHGSSSAQDFQQELAA